MASGSRHKPQSPTPSQLSSHGRGGAGNMANSGQSPKLMPGNLETPTLKSPVFTTGRGGSGSMANNDDAQGTRRRQDVEGLPRRNSSGAAQYTGRGGAGNVFKDHDDKTELARPKNALEDDDTAPAASATAPDRNMPSDLSPPSGRTWRFGNKAYNSLGDPSQAPMDTRTLSASHGHRTIVAMVPARCMIARYSPQASRKGD